MNQSNLKDYWVRLRLVAGNFTPLDWVAILAPFVFIYVATQLWSTFVAFGVGVYQGYRIRNIVDKVVAKYLTKPE